MSSDENLAKDAKEKKDAKEAFFSEEDRIAHEIVDAAYSIHLGLGPGLLESVYEVLLADELQSRGFGVRSQVPVGLTYAGRKFDIAFRADLIVDDLVLIELKSIEHLRPVHRACVITYLRLTELNLGLLINFGSGSFKGAVQRVANQLPESRVLWRP